MHFVNELCYTLIISIFSFLIFIHFTSQITSKQSLAQKLNLIFQLSSINWQINIPLGTHAWSMKKGWKNFYKVLYHCFKILRWIWCKFCSVTFLMLQVNKKLTYLKDVEKNNNAMHLRLLFIYLHQNVLNTKKYLALVLKKICWCTFLCIPN